MAEPGWSLHDLGGMRRSAAMAPPEQRVQLPRDQLIGLISLVQDLARRVAALEARQGAILGALATAVVALRPAARSLLRLASPDDEPERRRRREGVRGPVR